MMNLYETQKSISPKHLPPVISNDASMTPWLWFPWFSWYLVESYEIAEGLAWTWPKGSVLRLTQEKELIYHRATVSAGKMFLGLEVAIPNYQCVPLRPRFGVDMSGAGMCSCSRFWWISDFCKIVHTRF